MPRKTLKVLKKSTEKKTVKAKTYMAGKTVKSTANNSDDFRRRTEEKAFELFSRRGYQHGWHDYDWSMAENLVSLESANGNKSKLKMPSAEIVQKKAFEISAGRGFTPGAENVDWYLAEEFAKFE